MRPSLYLGAVVAVSGVLAAALIAQPPENAGDAPTTAGAPAILVTDEAARPAVSDCALQGPLDRDGKSARERAAAATRLLAKSHPSLNGEGVPPGSDQGQVGVVTRTPRVNFIDDEILGAMEKAGVTPAPLSSDAEFLRRVTLDLTGRIPDSTTVKTFLADKSADKRSKMIEQLLASDAFADRWAFFYDELFRNTFNADSGKLGFSGRNSLHAYFVESVRSQKPWNVMARELITATGTSADGGGTQKVDAPANFPVRNIQTNGPAQDTYDNLAAATGTVFLGVNIFCTSCHSGKGHTDSIDLWLTQQGRADFWGMASFYSRIQMRRQGTAPNYYFLVSDRAAGEYALGTTTGNKTPRDGTYWANGATSVSPKFILTDEVPARNETYRSALARMITASSQFSRAHVNYIWKEMFNLGIVEPADGFDLLRQDPENPPPSPWTIQPTHPRLLTRLADSYAGSGYNLRHLLRLITQSRSYQLSSSYPGEWKETYTPLFARHFVRRLRAEEVYDALSRATGVQPSLSVNGYPSPVLWAGQLPDVVAEPSNSRAIRLFLDAFIRGDRDTNKRSSEGTILQALSLMNDRTVTDRIKSATRGTLTNQLVTAKATPEETVNALYLGTLSRPPSASELAAGVALLQNLKQGQTAATVTEDLQFALLNKLDFIFNY